MKPLKRLEAEAKDEYQRALAAYQTEMLVAGVEAAAAKKDLEKAAERPEPVRRRYVTADATVEKLGELLRDNPDGIGVVRDELPGWLRAFDKPGHEGEREFMLEAANGTGESYKFDRIGRGTIEIPNPTISVVGGAQPSKLAPLVRDAARDGGDGLLRRFAVMVYPDDPGEWKKIDRWPDSAARDRAFALFKSLAGLTADAAGAEADRFDGTRFLRFAPDAQEVFYQWRGDLSARQRSPDVSPALESHLAKYPKLMPSVALLAHLCGVAEGGRPGPIPIHAATLAVRLCDCLASHAERVHGLGKVSDVAAAAALAKRIAAGKLPSPFTRRDIQLKGWAGLDERDAIRRAVAVLEDSGWVRVVETHDTGGAPREDVYINPRLPRALEKTP